MIQESSVYNDRNIIITSQKIQVSNNTYFIRNISSVGIAAISADNSALIICAVVTGSLSALTLYFQKYLVGVIFLVVTAFFIWILARSKPTYVLL